MDEKTLSLLEDVLRSEAMEAKKWNCLQKAAVTRD